MCLTIQIETDATERDALTAAAVTASTFGLHVVVDHPSRWRWAQRRPVRATISEEGSCACSLLSDDADWNAESWAMRSDVVEPLARTLEVLCQHGPARLVLEALWFGDRAEQEIRTSPAELAAIVRDEGLATRARYIVERAG